jgi:tRNA (guanine37-N1)-methyltransferase
MKVSLLTIFPQMFPGPLLHSLAGKALENGLFNLDVINIRDYALDKHQTVDDRVFGGGAGMLMKPEVIDRAIEAACAKQKPEKLIYFSPRGKKFTQEVARELVEQENLLMLCGRYEGVDQRIFDKYDFEEISIGDYILSGGEMAAITVLDACVRLIPGVIENEEANKEESFSSGEYQNLLEYDQYTRPANWQGMEVPAVLLSGNHKEISKWRLENAIQNTQKRRPDLLQ